MKQNIIIEITCFLLITLFIYAAFSKLFNYREFVSQLRNYPVIKNFATPVSIVLPLAEIIIATMLMVNITRRTGLMMSFIMMIIFTIFIICMLLFAKEVPCSCGGALKMLTWKQHIIFNSFFLLLAFIGFILENKQKKIAY